MITAFVRTLLLYFIIMAGLRLMGKRQIGELEPSELVLALLISDLAAVPMQDFGIPLLNGLIPIIVLLSVSMIISVLNLKSVRFRSLMCGEACIVVRGGKPVQSNMRAARFTIDELLQELRQQGITDLSTVKYAILETNGKLSVLQYSAFQSATPSGLNIASEDSVALPVVLVDDGHLMERNMREHGFDRAFVARQVELCGLASEKDVFLMTIDQNGGVLLIPKDGAKKRSDKK
jgi:uncharacterized membrane protein YcaP (DUF421 family)